MHPSPGYVLGLWPDATPLELDDGGASPVLDELVQGPSAALTAVALVAGEAVRASGWAARAAVAIARQWRGPRRVVLVDLDLERPALHEAAGVPADEGVADLLDFGLSLAAVRRPVADGAFDVVTAGLYVADAGALLHHEGWSRVLLETGLHWNTLLAWVPASADGALAVVERSGAVLVLADPAEADAVVRGLPHPYAVLAVLTPAPADADLVTATDVAREDTEPAPDTDAPEPVVVAAASDEVVAAAGTGAEPIVVAAAADELLHGPPVGATAMPADRVPAAATAREAPVDAAAPADAAPTGAAPIDAAARDALIRGLRERQRAARMTPPGRVPPDAVQPAGVPAAPEDGRAHAPRPNGTELDADDAAVGATEPTEAAVLVPSSGSEHAREMRVESAADDVSPDEVDLGAAARAAARSRASRPVVVAGPPPHARRRRRPLVWTVIAVLLLSLLAGTWRFLAGRLGWGFRAFDRAEPTAPAVPEPPPPAAVVPAVREVELPYAVAMEAHTDAVAATSRVETLRAAEAAITFHVAPLEREGALYYHVMAGPVRDSTAALALRDTLLARRHKTTTTPNDVRYAPLAFLVGDYGSRFMAQDQMLELRRLDVPSYLLLAEAEDGEPLYRVYVGGFATPAEAEAARQLLRAAGVRDSLVTRTGSIAP